MRRARLAATFAAALVAVGAYFASDGDLPFFPDEGAADVGQDRDRPAAGIASSGSSVVDVPEALQQLDGLRVAVEDTGASYDRDEWPHWSSQGHGCDTREVALREQGRDVATDEDCRAVSGSWTSSYDGVVVSEGSDTDVDHMVPLAEAARSGTRGWDEDRREAFANDLDQLVVVTARSNRQKADQDPARWLPERDRCGYVAHWVQVKAEYHLTVDVAERDALVSVLRRCGGPPGDADGPR